jgi:predicted metal-binding protein
MTTAGRFVEERSGAGAAPVIGRIFVCRTCDRYAPLPAGEPTRGGRLAAALLANPASPGHQVTVRAVECLNGCPHPCTAALRGAGKYVIRFSGLDPSDVPALIEIAERYAESADGNIPDEAFPGSLRGKVSLRVAPVRAS